MFCFVVTTFYETIITRYVLGNMSTMQVSNYECTSIGLLYSIPFGTRRCCDVDSTSCAHWDNIFAPLHEKWSFWTRDV